MGPSVVAKYLLVIFYTDHLVYWLRNSFVFVSNKPYKFFINHIPYANPAKFSSYDHMLANIIKFDTIDASKIPLVQIESIIIVPVKLALHISVSIITYVVARYSHAVNYYYVRKLTSVLAEKYLLNVFIMI